MEEYLAKREALILEDRAKRVDHATSRAFSSEERRADEIIRHIRRAEAEVVWDPAVAVNHDHGSQQLFPGMEFLTGRGSVDIIFVEFYSYATVARQTITDTKTFDILSKVRSVPSHMRVILD